MKLLILPHFCIWPCWGNFYQSCYFDILLDFKLYNAIFCFSKPLFCYWSEASYSCSIMYGSVWENTAKNNDSHKKYPYNLIEKSSSWCFRIAIDTICKYNSQEIVFFPFVTRLQISSWQITICKSIFINCEMAIPKILETVSGKKISIKH